jgi:hypothetical protein
MRTTFAKTLHAAAHCRSRRGVSVERRILLRYFIFR